jgi:rare lipoprotein A
MGPGAAPSAGLVARLSGIGAGVSLVARIGAVAGCCLALAHCGKMSGKVDPKYGVSASPRVVQLGEPVPKGGGVYRIGKPYVVGGRTYTPEQSAGYRAEGVASWYGEDFHGRLTANGEVYDMAAISAAHPTLPIPSYVRVTNLANKRSIIARVNDRGPYHQNRLIDVSVRTAKLLGFYDQGTARVRVDYVGPASLDGSDDSRLEATLRRGTPAPGPAEVQVASSRSLLPRLFDPKPAPSSEFSAVTREPIGPVAAMPNATAGSAPRRVASGERASSFEARFGPVAGMPAAGARIEPVPAYASPEPSSGAVVTGRGLY